MNFIKRLLMAYMRFMQGRYARIDHVNILILFLYLLLSIVTVFFNHIVIRIIMFALSIVFVYRFFSRNIAARIRENEKLDSLLGPLHLGTRAGTFFSRLHQAFGFRRSSSSLRNDPNYVYFPCPYCRKNLRVPKGRGKIMVTCPICTKQFPKET